MKKQWLRSKIISTGSFGTVSLALNQSQNTIFAVKSINLNSSPPQAISSLQNEILLLSSLNSPNIISYLGQDITDEPAGRSLNLHMEYLPAGTAAGVAAAGKMTDFDVRRYTRCVVKALHHLHTTAGVVHGDVKGRNVLIGSPAGEAKLADFGSARRIGDSADAGGEGTVLWMSPEVARGGPATPAADVWSLGCTVIEMVSGGRQPWGELGIVGGSLIGQMFRIGFCDVLPEIPDWMSKIGRDFVGKCLRRDAGERWSCEELLRHSFLDGWAEMSPRSILEVGFEEGEDGGEEEGDCEVGLVRERIRGLGSEEVRWGGEGWLEVRSGL